MKQRFLEHHNVVDLVFYRTVWRVMREHGVGAAAAIKWIELAQVKNYPPTTLQQMWDQYDPGRVIWVDEETFYGELHIKWTDGE